MNKGSLVVLCGISGSGKSFYAHEKWEENPLTTVVINRDKIRELLFGYTEQTVSNYYSRPDISKLEKQVTHYEDTLIYEALQQDKIVIVDATHLKREFISRFEKFNVTVELKWFDIELNEAINRDSKRIRKVGDTVIIKQFENYKNLKENFNSYCLWCYMNLIGNFPLVLKEHPIHINYFGGSDGNIYSLKKGKPKNDILIHDGKAYKKLIGHKGGTNNYLSFVPFNTGVNKKSKMVHKFIYECFNNILLEEEAVKCISHKDGNSFNNKPNNLKSETYSENLKRKIAHGTDSRLFKNSRSSVTEKEYSAIKYLLENKLLTHEIIANAFNLTRTYITKLWAKIKKYD